MITGVPLVAKTFFGSFLKETYSSFFLRRYPKLLSPSKCWRRNFNFLLVRLKALCLSFSEPSKWVAGQIIAYALHHQQGKQAFVKENKKPNNCVKEICKILEINGSMLFSTNDYSLLESFQSYIIVMYKASHCSRINQICQACFFSWSLWNHQNFRSDTFDYNWYHWLPHGLPHTVTK